MPPRSQHSVSFSSISEETRGPINTLGSEDIEDLKEEMKSSNIKVKITSVVDKKNNWGFFTSRVLTLTDEPVIFYFKKKLSPKNIRLNLQTLVERREKCRLKIITHLDDGKS